MSDETLAVKNGSDVLVVRHDLSIESLISSHYVDLFRYAFRLTSCKHDAEDLTQQVFLTAHDKLHQLRDVGAARGWLYQILRSLFFKMCRKRKPVLAADAEVEMNGVIDDQVDQPFDIERLQQRLGELNESYRVVLLMFYFEGKPYEQIASELDIPIGTVMSRISRGKSHLRTRIRPVETAQ